MVDRNQAIRDREQAEREFGQQLQKFARLLSEGKTGMIDRFGIKLEPGHYVLYRPPHDLIFEVIDIVPVMDRSQPAGALVVKLACDTSVQFVAGQRAMTMLKCGEKARDEPGKTDITPPGSQPPTQMPPDDPDAEAKVLDEQARADAASHPPDEEPPV